MSAECYSNKAASQIGIIYGATDLNDNKGHYVKAKKLILHEEYVQNQPNNDIAIVRLARDIFYSKKAQPTVLPTRKEIHTKNGIFTGWGRESVSILKIILLTENK